MAELRRLVSTYVRWRYMRGDLGQDHAQALRRKLWRFADALGGRRWGRKAIEDWWASTVTLAPGTRRNYRSAVSGFCDWMVREGHIQRNPMLDLPAVKVPKQVHRVLESTEGPSLLDCCVDQRERVILTLGLQQGMRRVSISRCEVGDFSWQSGIMQVRNKGGRIHAVPIAAETEREVKAYLRQVPAVAGPLVRRLDGRGGIKPGTVGLIFRRIAERAGVKVAPGDGVGTHIMRHTAATDVEANCHDPRAVQEFLGHEHLSSTEIYLGQLPSDRLRSAVEGRCYCGDADCGGGHDNGDESPLNILGRLIEGDTNLLKAIQQLIDSGLIDPGVGT
jgi:integrase